MRHSTRFIAAATLVAAAALPFAAPASAACTRLGFSVNDYGKDGPTRDAKQLLDKYIAKWTADRGITKYTTGKKDVTCELFLNFILFDEHTCKAEASVCWDGPAVKGGETAAATGGAEGEKSTEKKAAVKSVPVKATVKAAAPTETGSTAKAEPAKTESKPAAEAPKADAPKADAPAATETEKPAAN